MLRDEGTLVLIVGQECPGRVEIDAGSEVRAVAFAPNSEYLVSGGWEDVQVWRVKTGERVAAMPVDGCVWNITVSKDGRLIAAKSDGDVLVWDATTYEQVFVGHNESQWPIWDVDFSPDSTRLISADGLNYTVTIWDITGRQRVRTLDHGEDVLAAKYSPRGGQIATATHESILVWDGEDGRKLLVVDVKVPRPSCSLLWFNNHLFVKTEDSKIKQIDASTGSTLSEWSVPDDKDRKSVV